MDAAGEMIGFDIHQRSARIALASDRRLQQACNDAFFDRNPPPGARAKDGKHPLRVHHRGAVAVAARHRVLGSCGRCCEATA